MELNAERHFSAIPATYVDHSRFNIPYDWTCTINAGLLNCFYVDEWIPGDIHNISTSHLTRMTTPVAAPFDTCFLDVYYFFVPWRLVWSHSKEFFGENNSTYWTQPTEYTIPSVNISSWTRTPGDLLHQMGITLRPVNSGNNCLINTLQLRSYQKVFNDYFRDENTQSPIAINMADNGDTSALNTLLPVNRIHDMFGSCLPGPQKSSNGVALALEGFVPVSTMSNDWSETVLKFEGLTNFGMKLKNSSGTVAAGNLGSNGSGYAVNTTGSNTSTNTVHPSNLAADVSSGSIDINQFRLALQTQKVLEALARGGSRYVEILQSIYGVKSDDARLQRPEFLGGERWYINMADNVQTSETGTTPLGTVGGYSKTFGRSQNGPVSYSVREHGFGLGVACIRHNRSYSQMIPKQFRRTNFFSIYNPKFAHLGEQPVYVSEICADYIVPNAVGPQDPSQNIFGFQEYAYEYRWKNSILAGQMAPGATVVPAGQTGAGDPTALGTVWTYGDYYKSAPSLSDSWMREGDEAVKRTLQVPTEDQFFCSIHVNDDAIRPMPMYSVPGFVDHF